MRRFSAFPDHRPGVQAGDSAQSRVPRGPAWSTKKTSPRRPLLRPARCATRRARSGPEFVETVAEAIGGRDAGLLRALVGELHESDAGDLIEALDPDLRPQLIELMGKDFDFTALTEVDDTVREEILEELPTETVAEGVRELDSDDAVYILEDLPKDEQAEILEQLPPPERVALARAPRLSGRARPGGACRPSSSRCRRPGPSGRPSTTCARPRTCRSASSKSMWSIAAGKFLGAVPLDRLMRTKRPVPMSELMEPERHVVRATDDQEEVARRFERYNLVAAPVVDDDDRMVGVITFDDIVDVIEQEAEEDIKALGGVKGEEELSDSVWTIAKSRFNWLLVNLGDRVPRLLGARPVRGRTAEDGRARGARADRREPGRQCRRRRP